MTMNPNHDLAAELNHRSRRKMAEDAGPVHPLIGKTVKINAPGTRGHGESGKVLSYRDGHFQIESRPNEDTNYMIPEGKVNRIGAKDADTDCMGLSPFKPEAKDADPRQEKKAFRKMGMADPVYEAYVSGQAAKPGANNPYPPGKRHDEFERGRETARAQEGHDGMANEHAILARHYQSLISQYPDATQRPEWERRMGEETRRASASSAAGMDAPSRTNGPRQLVDRAKNGKPIYYRPSVHNYETQGNDGETYVFRSLEEAKSFQDERGGSAAIKDAQDPTLATAQEEPMTVALREAHGIIDEAAKKAGMSKEDYLAQRSRAHPGHLRTLQRKEMEI